MSRRTMRARDDGFLKPACSDVAQLLERRPVARCVSVAALAAAIEATVQCHE